MRNDPSETINEIESKASVSREQIQHWASHGVDLVLLERRIFYIINVLLGNITPQILKILTGEFQHDCLDDILSSINNGNTATHYVALSGNITLLKKIAAQDPTKLTEKSDLDFNLAHYAALSGNVALLEWMTQDEHLSLLLDKSSWQKILPTHFAAMSGSIEALHFFEKHYPETLSATTNTQSMTRINLVDFAVSSTPEMLKYAASLSPQTTEVIDFQKAFFKNRELAVLVGAIQIGAAQLKHAKIPGFEGRGAHPYLTFFTLHPDNKKRLALVTDSSSSLDFQAIVALGQGERQQQSHFYRVNPDIVIHIASFLIPASVNAKMTRKLYYFYLLPAVYRLHSLIQDSSIPPYAPTKKMALQILRLFKKARTDDERQKLNDCTDQLFKATEAAKMEYNS